MTTEKAKNRVIDVGARFSTFEHENARETVGSDKNTSTAQSSGRSSFWKKGTSKLPGRPIYGAQHPPLQTPDSTVLETYSKNSKANKGKKHQITFQEFQGSTNDAWDEAEDDIIRVSDDAGMSMSPPREEGTFHGSDVRERIITGSTEGESSALSTTEGGVSHELESKDRQPQAQQNAIDSKLQRAKPSVKETLVSKLSETLSKTRSRMSPSPPSPNAVEAMQAPLPPSPIHQTSVDLNEHENVRLEKFGKLLAGPTTDLEQLRKLSWNGIPAAVRSATWQLLSGYVPPGIDRRSETLRRKREEYYNFVEKYYPTRFEDAYNEDTYRQIHIDIPRTNPLIPIFQQHVVQELFERILYIWAIRHPASGYVQGINDLVVPFFIVFVSEHTSGNVEEHDIGTINKEVLDCVEADTFWCVSKLLDGIQDNYTFAQPGIQMKVHALQDLVDRIDRPLNCFIASHKIDYLQFTFRWMNNLLMRELPLWCTIRLWDTYWSEPNGFALFHFYVCAALLTHFSKQIKAHVDFQGLMVFLQNLPTKNWNEEDVSILVAEAYRLKFMFADAPKHLKTN